MFARVFSVLSIVGLLAGSFVLVSVLAAPQTAVLRIAPTSGNQSVGTDFAVDLRLDTGGENVAGVLADISFSSNLQLVNADAAGSVFDEEVYSTGAANSLQVWRARLDSGFGGADGQVLRLTFRPLSAGTATVTIDASISEVLAFSDSTNILQSIRNGSFDVSDEVGDGTTNGSFNASGGEGDGTTGGPWRAGGGDSGGDSGGAGTPNPPPPPPMPDPPPTRCSLTIFAGKPLPDAYGRLRLRLADRQAVTFLDVPTNIWFAQYVASAIQSQITSGYKAPDGTYLGLYGPERNATYAEIAKMVLNLRSEDVRGIMQDPQNMSARGDWSAPYIRRAEDLKVSIYMALPRVGEPMSRGAVLQAVLEILGISLDKYIPNPYTDLSATHQYAAAILTATQMGVVRGDTGKDGKPLHRFRPDSDINRAEVAKILVELGQKMCQ